MNAISRISVFTMGVTVLLLAGCGKPADMSSKPNETNDNNHNSNNTVSTKEITITPVNLKQYNDEIAKHKGKVVLVDFWADWCINCKKAFPHTVKLYHEQKDAGLEVISMSMDVPDEDNKLEAQMAKDIKFLKSEKAVFTNLIANPKDPEEAFGTFEIPEGLPHYKLYGRDGKLIQTFSGTGEKVKAAINVAVKKAFAEKS